MSGGADLIIRPCRADELEEVIGLLYDDVLGAEREATDAIAPYRTAFAEIEADPGSTVYIAEAEGRIVGCYQLNIMPNLSFQGARRAQIEGVRVADAARGQGLGERLMRHAVDVAREQGCGIVQLTSNRERAATLRFYERLGFLPSHVGFKLYL